MPQQRKHVRSEVLLASKYCPSSRSSRPCRCSRWCWDRWWQPWRWSGSSWHPRWCRNSADSWLDWEEEELFFRLCTLTWGAQPPHEFRLELSFTFSFGHSLIKTFLPWEQRRCKKETFIIKYVQQLYSWYSTIKISIETEHVKKNWHHKEKYFLWNNAFSKLNTFCFQRILSVSFWLHDPLQRLD